MFEMPIELSGKSTEDKLIDINKMLHKAGADCTILSALDEVAWTFNIRGTDVAYNPGRHQLCIRFREGKRTVRESEEDTR